MMNMPEFVLNGSVKLNNTEMTRQTFNHLGAYLEQQDVLYEFQNCKELFKDAAKLRTNMSDKEID